MNARTRAQQRGTTLLEAMVAMAVLFIGAAGVMTVHKVGLKLNANARTTTRAAAIAQDLIEHIWLWDYNDRRLSTGAHVEADLTAGGAVWNGIPTADVSDAQCTRSWSVQRVDNVDGDAVWDAARVSVTVTLPTGTSITMYTVKRNPAER